MITFVVKFRSYAYDNVKKGPIVLESGEENMVSQTAEITLVISVFIEF